MIIIASALIPILVTILLGYAIKRSNMLSQDFWSSTESLTYYILTPSLLISILANRPLSQLPWVSFISAVVITVLVSAIIIIVYQSLFKTFSSSTFTSVFQGGVRFNTFVALVLVSSLYGDEGLSYAALAATAMIILINILCVSVFSISMGNEGIKILSVLKQIAKNPLILGAGSGILLNLSGVGLHPILVDSLDLFGRAAFPLGLMLVGAALSFKGISLHYKPILISSIVQFIIKPVCAVGVVLVFKIDPVPAMVLIIFMCVPTAPSAYILARKLGGDAAAMASIITSQTLIGFVSIPLIIFWASEFIG
ncbi:MAG: AEC family transporter [Oceanospirillaceae bacterium]|nr:AEC family transporter [Oceanospirillaceae bacterium]